MITINDFAEPFDAINEFEQVVAAFTGAPYCVSTDCCTHAIELCLRYDQIKNCKLTPYTYLSVPMTLHKLGIKYEYLDHDWCRWVGEYQFLNTRIWDSARGFKKNMYKEGQVQCVSFGKTKPLEIGYGGCILTDDKDLYLAASRMRYDGRDIFSFKPWSSQKTFNVGYHYYMRPEDCVKGLNKLHNNELLEQIDQFYNYPDLRKITIVDNTI
jgi:dTDP-4-amino-4,6-dideoxygalactose transaminase